MSFKNRKANGYEHDFELLINSHIICVFQYATRSGCKEKSIHLKRHVNLIRRKSFAQSPHPTPSMGKFLNTESGVCAK